MKKTIRKENYLSLITDLTSLIEQGRKAAVRYVNTALVATYWLIGRRIVEYEQKGKERAEYGKALLKRLSVDLTNHFGKGFGYINLNLMRQFYLTYPPQKILQTVSEELSPEEGTRQNRRIVRTVSAELLLAEIARCFPLPWSAYVRLLSVEKTETRKFWLILTNAQNVEAIFPRD